MNKTIIAERFSKAIATYPREANVQRQIADKMIRLLKKYILSPCPKVIEFGCGTGAAPYPSSGRVIAERSVSGNEILLRRFIKGEASLFSFRRCRNDSFSG